MAVAPKIIGAIMNAPLPELIERLGMSVANAQAALDRNSIALANAMAVSTVRVNDNDYNLISLGFAPTFYAFTEATVEAKMEFSLMEAEDFSIGASANIGGGNSNSNESGSERSSVMYGISVNAAYARKFELSASASSSIAARIISIPAPELFKEILNGNAVGAVVPVTAVLIDVPGYVIDNTIDDKDDPIQLSLTIQPSNATNKNVTWSIVSGTGNISTSGLFTPVQGVGQTVKVRATSEDNSEIFGELEIIVEFNTQPSI